MSDLSKIIVPFTFMDNLFTKDNFDVHTFHAHQSMELCYVVSGTAGCTYYPPNREEPETIMFRKNEFILIRPNIRHKEFVPKEAHLLIFEFRHFNPEISTVTFIANSDFTALLPAAKEFMLNLKPITVLTDSHEVQRRLKKLLKLLYDERHNAPSPYFGAYYEIYLKSLFIEIGKCATMKRNLNYNRYIQYVASYIQGNYGKNVSLKQIAQSLSRSPVYLNSLFKKEIGQSIREYLIATRMRAASKLLMEQDYTISATARRVGYSNLRTFEIAFFKTFGMSPSQFIKDNRPTGFMFWQYHDSPRIGADKTIFKEAEK